MSLPTSQVASRFQVLISLTGSAQMWIYSCTMPRRTGECARI
jgi:hypothetical protein